MSGLNLLPNYAKFRAAKINLINRLKKYLLIVVVVWIAIVLAVLGWWIVTNENLKNAKKKEKNAESALSSISSTIIVSQDLKYKAKQVGSVLSGRTEYFEKFEKMNSFKSVDMPPIDIKMDKDSDKFVVDGTTVNGTDIDKIEKAVQEINEGKREFFKSAKILNLVEDNGIWKFSVEVLLK